jgi:Zinc knuckle
MAKGTCFTCGEPGHFAPDCPENTYAELGAKAESFDEHIHRIEQIVASWQAGRIRIGQKRKLISDENKSWYGTPPRKELTWP